MLLLSRATERLDNVLYDVLVGYVAPPVSDQILLVAIDDASVAAIGRWPWSRNVHAKFLKQVAAAHPSAVAYDVLFTEHASGDQDLHLSKAIAELGNVALPVLFERPGSNGRAVDVILPIKPIANAAHAIGEVALVPDNEGVVRSVPLMFVAESQAWPHLMETTYRIAFGHPSSVFERLAAKGEGLVTIPFQSRSGNFRTVSFASVFAGEVPPEFMKDRILLVGVTAAGLGDRFRVPTRTGTLISGIELQANVLNSLLADRIIVLPSIAGSLLAAILPASLLLVGFWFLRPSWAFAASMAMIALILIVPPALLLLFHMWLAPTPALVGLFVAYPLWGWRRLHALDRVIGDELDSFAGEKMLIPVNNLASAYLDPIGGQAARLRLAISNMRDLRQLVSDTIDGVSDPILVTDPDDRVILMNISARTLFGEADEGTLSSRLLEKLAGERIVFDAQQSEIRLADGKVFSPRRFPLRNHANKQRGWIVHLVDISVIRMMQLEREEAFEFLSHDMRSPQSSIITLIEGHRGAFTDNALAERISALAKRTLKLSDAFVQMARLSGASFVPEDVNLADIMIEAADELWPLASRRHVRIAIEGAEDAFFIQGEYDTLLRALVNLLDNAVKFSPEGAVVQCSIRFAGNEMVECVIEDEGPGIPADRRQNLFAKFGARRVVAGSRISAGLGLAYVGAAVGRHGGTILYEPRDPQGTRFVLRFSASEWESGASKGA